MGKRKSVGTEDDGTPIKAVDFNELPPEFLKSDKPLGLELHVFNILFIGLLTHVCMAYYLLYLFPFGYLPRWTIVVGIIYGYMSGLGTTCGSHRLWTHKTYKSNKAYQVLLMLMQTSGVQHSIFKWCRDHRVHHKYMDTNADPHSAARGFWFSHITWLFQPRHPDLVKGLRTIDISDLARDPVVRFQSKYYWQLVLLTSYIIPMAIFYFIFPEMSLLHNFVTNQTRYGVSLHFTFLVNSAAHLWGDKPFDKYITPTENRLVSLLAVGEGWHNYHHTFPWDYKSAEFGYKINFSTLFIDFFAMIGWVWDMKTVSHKLLVDRINRTGDGSHPLYNHNNNNAKDDSPAMAPNTCWGWGDKELTEEDMKVTETVFPSKSRRG